MVSPAFSPPELALLENVLELFERPLLEPRDVHLRDVEALCDLRLADVLVKPQVEDDALAPCEDFEGPLQVRAVLEQLEAGVVLPDVVRQGLRLLVALAAELRVE